MTSVTLYPGAIARACAVIDETPIFRDLPDGYLRVLVRIIKKISIARPTTPIVAARGTLARESGKSVETVGRVVRWLEERGLIERQQVARRGLCGSSSPITPTRALLEALHLCEPSARASQAVQAQTSSTQHAPTQPRPAFIRLGEHSIPADLAFLHHDNALPVTGILALMRLARDSGKRLSDVVMATRRYLERLSGRSLFAYLRRLVLAERDFAAVAQEDLREHQSAQQRARLEHKALELKGRVFRSRDRRTLVVVEAAGRLRIDGNDGIRRYGRLDADFLEALDSGRLVAATEFSTETRV